MLQKQFRKLIRDQQKIPMFSVNTKLLILSSKVNEKDSQILKVLSDFSITNFVIMYEKDDKIFINSKDLIDERNWLSEIYTDQKVAQRRTYNLLAFSDKQSVMIQKNHLYTKYDDFLRMIAKRENSIFQFTTIDLRAKNYDYVFRNLSRYKGFDFSLSSRITYMNYAPKLMTYETRSYCFIVPMTPAISSNDLVFFKVRSHNSN